MKGAPLLTHPSVATPPCWGDISRLSHRLSHASSAVLGVVLLFAFRPNVDSFVAAAAVLILSSSLTLSSLLACTDAQLGSSPLPSHLSLPCSPSCQTLSAFYLRTNALQAKAVTIQTSYSIHEYCM